MKILKKKSADYVIIGFGGVLYAVSFNLFLRHAQIAPGGITGISLVINHVFPLLSMGTLILIFNIPLFLLGLRKIGGAFIKYTVFATVMVSLAMDLSEKLPPFTQEPLLASIYGGVLTGAGLGIVLLRGGSTGGTDIVARVLRLYNPELSMGRIMLLIDIAVISLAAAVFRNINSALYAIITMYVASLVIDAILYGLDIARVAYIITDRYEEINSGIAESLGRGATLIKCEGAYTGSEHRMIMCAIKRNQITELKGLVHKADPSAFMIVTNVHEVLGYGFQSETRR